MPLDTVDRNVCVQCGADLPPYSFVKEEYERKCVKCNYRYIFPASNTPDIAKDSLPIYIGLLRSLSDKAIQLVHLHTSVIRSGAPTPFYPKFKEFRITDSEFLCIFEHATYTFPLYAIYSTEKWFSDLKVTKKDCRIYD